MLITIEDFLVQRHSLPIIDVRSESEFDEGHIRNAINIPILNNEERAAVGTDYKLRGQQEAIRTGFRLVGPRLADIIDKAKQVGSEVLVHCWRGGMRSSNFCQFIAMAGIKSHQLRGGYKAYRQKALETFESQFNFISITGCTGSGKSEVLRALAKHGEQVLDLEMLANHKGSAFGGLGLGAQPTTEQFQNDLFEEILKLDLSKSVWIEDESIAIGKIFLPQPLWQQLTNSSLVQMDVPKDIRVQRLVGEYGDANREEFLSIMMKIVKKLGGQHFNVAKEKLIEGDMASVINILLTYYDKAYLSSITKRQNNVKSILSWDGKNMNEMVKAMIKARIEL